MWRRLVSSQLKTLATASASASTSATTVAATACRSARFLSTHRSSVSLFNRAFSTDSANGVVKKKVEDAKPVATGYEPEVVKKKVEDVMPIATGHEREEVEAELEGRDILEIDHPVGPFGTKEEPAVVKSYYDKRIVGCPGGEGEDEHDVVWFWLEKGKPHECPVCSQYFELEVVGPGGPPDGHGDDDEDEHHH